MSIKASIRPSWWMAGLVMGGASACAPLVTTVPHPVQLESREASEGFAVIDTEDELKEVTFSGRQFGGRDEVEGYLLYRAALLTTQNGFGWFVLRHLPGEGGPDVHPLRLTPSFGAAYGHWQPHWNYYLKGVGWQPWHPEWGVRFWADEVNPKEVERYEAHAMIKMEHEFMPSDAGMSFDANRVVRDLGPRFSRVRS